MCDMLRVAKVFLLENGESDTRLLRAFKFTDKERNAQLKALCGSRLSNRLSGTNPRMTLTDGMRRPTSSGMRYADFNPRISQKNLLLTK